MNEMRKKTLGERILNLLGYRIWPENRDPRICGPQPRIITRRQWKAMQKMASDASSDDGQAEQ